MQKHCLKRCFEELKPFFHGPSYFTQQHKGAHIENVYTHKIKETVPCGQHIFTHLDTSSMCHRCVTPY